MTSQASCPECGSSYDATIQSGCAACQIKLGLGETPQASAPPQIPLIPIEELAQKFEDLEILELIGVGGMGAVYRARQKKLDRIVAIKIVRPDIAESDEFSQRFEREAKAMARLNHPNIVSIYDFGNSDGIYYYLMELVDGPNLAELARSENLSPNETLEIVTQVCKAMQYAHDNGVVHRDIKPTNILLNAEGSIKIADFGLAKLCSAGDPTTQLTQTQQVFGTPRYMAPEQIEATREVDHRADIYSLGVVFYELLTGELPLGRFDPPSQKINVDVRLDEVVLRALEKHPERRYQAARDFETDISQIVQPVPPVKYANVGVASTVAYQADENRPSWLVAGLVISGSMFSAIGIYGLSMLAATAFFPANPANGSGRAANPVMFMGFVAGMIGLFMMLTGLVIAIRTIPHDYWTKLKSRSPVRLLLNFRTLNYMLLTVALIAAAVPWIELIGDRGVGYVFGFQIWIGFVVGIAFVIGIPLLVFIDFFEGNGFYYFVCQAALSIGGMCGAFAVMQPPLSREIATEFMIRSRFETWNTETIGTILMVVACTILLILSVVGLIVCGINKLLSSSVKERAGRFIATAGSPKSLHGILARVRKTLVQWRDRFSEFVNGKD